MDRTAAPAFNGPPPTSSSDPRQQTRPDIPSTGTTKEIAAHNTSGDGIEGAKPGVTDGPKNPDPSSGSGPPGTGTEYNTHMKGTAAPGSHSALFGLSPGEERVHPPAELRSAPGTGVIGMGGHKGSHNASTSAGIGMGSGGVGAEEGGNPSLIDRLNPMKDADGDGERGFSD